MNEKDEALLLLEMVTSWRHVFKLDPQKELSDADLQQVCQSETDAIIVGGTDGITFDNSVELLGRIRRYELPCVQEVSSRNAIVPGFDGYLIPIVLNASEVEWIVGAQHEAVKEFGGMIPWSDVLAEGYVVLNPHSHVAKRTRSRTALTANDVTAYAEVAERLYNLSLFYVEYSGMYGDIDIVRAAQKGLNRARLVYGGGIRSVKQAQEMASVADTVVIGNYVYENIEGALKTVKAVKG